MAVRILVVALALSFDCAAAVTASGRNWRISIDSIECAAATMTLATRIRYLGPRGPVEAPVSRLADGEAKPHSPKSVAWQGGSKPVAEWLSSGGLRNLQSEDVGEIQLKFDLSGARGDLQLEFGDIRAFPLTRKRTSACQGILRPDQVQPPRVSSAKSGKPGMRVYRNAYPCAARSGSAQTTEAEFPPYLPRQLLLFGRGYLPSAREVDLPMGRAAAQSYFYAGPDELHAVEERARRAMATDFPEYAKKHFAFNWGPQRSESGNELYSVGIYELRACPEAPR